MPRGKANSKEPEDFKSKFRRSKDKKEPIKESKKKIKKGFKKKIQKII
jgi:hypothetical protein